jgi:hypothetical protein
MEYIIVGPWPVGVCGVECTDCTCISATWRDLIVAVESCGFAHRHLMCVYPVYPYAQVMVES